MHGGGRVKATVGRSARVLVCVAQVRRQKHLPVPPYLVISLCLDSK